MKKLIVTSATFLLLVAPLVLASPALAANQLTFDADTTLDMVSPDVNLTILSGSTLDSLTAYGSTINFTISNGGSLVIKSNDKKNFTHNIAGISVNNVCANDYSQITVGSANSETKSFTITVGSDTCSSGISGGGTVSSGGGGGTTTSHDPLLTTDTTATTETAETATGATSATPETTAEPAPTTGGTASFAQQLANILSEATDVITANAETLIAKVGGARSAEAEKTAESKYINPLLKGINAEMRVETADTMTNFVTYGTPTTKALGAGERAGVLNSFKNAYDKIPETEIDWQDTIKIANGRFPTQQAIEKEKGALAIFGKIYLKMPDFKNTHDNAAIKIIAYGIRPTSRNLDSEKAAIKSFEHIYKHKPATTTDWDIMRAIAYSGAKR